MNVHVENQPNCITTLRVEVPAEKVTETWEAIARGPTAGDSEPSLFEQFQAATSQDLKDDIAAGMARAGNSGGAPPRLRATFRSAFRLPPSALALGFGE